jgi:hypothetical protein
VAPEPDRLSDETRAELRALQRRAYGPDADIHTDPDALARLRELEEAATPPAGAAEPAAVEESPTPDIPSAVSEPPPPQRSRRMRVLVGAAAAVVAAAVVAAGIAPVVAANEEEDSRRRAAEAAERRLALDADLPTQTVYDLYLDGKRDEVLRLPGAEGVASRMVREEMRPYGRLYGRLVGAGPTRDDRVCMIVENEPTAATVCLASWTPLEIPATLVFPAPQFDASSPGAVTYVGYTLRSDGRVVARPGADPAAAAVPEPTRTATPAPGTQ